jgi:general secretion pathway protein B
MSFILDALKKSESERQRADAPALFEVKKAPSRQGVATWLLVLAGLLVINIVVLGVVLLRGSHDPTPATEASTAAAPAMASPAPVPAPPAAAPPVAAPAAPATVASAPVMATPTPAPDSLPNRASASADAADDAPAVEPSPRTPPTQGMGPGDVPTYQQAATAPGANLPDLKLDLHAYTSNPSDRFVFLNMLRLKEGQSSPAGVRVESITPDGAILSWHGMKFFLQRQ